MKYWTILFMDKSGFSCECHLICDEAQTTIDWYLANTHFVSAEVLSCDDTMPESWSEDEDFDEYYFGEEVA